MPVTTEHPEYEKNLQPGGWCATLAADRGQLNQKRLPTFQPRHWLTLNPPIKANNNAMQQFCHGLTM